MPRSSKTGVRGLFRGSDGLFRIDLRLRNPTTGDFQRIDKRLPKGTRLAAAKKYALDLLNGAVSGTYQPDKPEGRRLCKALDEYQVWRETNRRAALDRTEVQIGHLKDQLGDVELEAIEPEDLERYKQVRLSKAKPATVNRELALFKHFVRYAAQRDWVGEARAAQLRRVALLKEPPGRVRDLTPDEESRLLAKCAARTRAIVVAALLTGMRQGEIIGLRTEQVHLDAREIILTRTKSNRVRRVPIAESLVPVLEKALAASRSGFVFENRLGQPYTACGLRCLFNRARKEAKLGDFRFHDLRHACATALRRTGADLDVIRRILGHSTLAMTLRYAHVSDELMRDAVAALPAPRLPEIPDVAGPLPARRHLRIVRG